MLQQIQIAVLLRQSPAGGAGGGAVVPSDGVIKAGADLAVSSYLAWSR